MNKKNVGYIILFVIIGCLIMAWVDAYIKPNYAIKSFIKIILFLLLPLIYSILNKDISLRNLFIFERKKFLKSLLMGLLVYVFIVGSYLTIGSLFDFTNVTTSLEDNIGVNKNNFVFVAIYISLINSLLEEFFFRGFAFLTLKKITFRKFAYIFSAGAFSLYHIAIMTSWFSPFLFVLLIISLFIAGLFLNWLNERNNNIYSSWMVHMFANFAINTIGFILFGIL